MVIMIMIDENDTMANENDIENVLRDELSRILEVELKDFYSFL